MRQQPPAISQISPASGYTSGGTEVTITGAAFMSGAEVTFGNVPATNVTISGTTLITAVAPPHAAGVVHVSVTNPTGLSALRLDAYTYLEPPRIDAVSPSFGSVDGGTVLTIRGYGFAPSPTVNIGGLAALVTSASSTVITAVTPPHAETSTLT